MEQVRTTREGKRSDTTGRRGVVYLMVLMVTTLVVVMCVGGVSVARSAARRAGMRDDAEAARRNAEAAITAGRSMIESDVYWRTRRSNGFWFTDTPTGDGTMTLEVRNLAGVLNRSAIDPILMVGKGVKGGATHEIQLTMNADRKVATCLDAALTAGGLITFTTATVTSNQGVIMGNVGVTAALSTIIGNVESGLAIAGITYKGTTTAGVAARTIPGSDVFDPYVAAGTSVTMSTVPTVVLVGKQVSQKLLSPLNNPFGGGTNAQGVYIFDCGGQALQITNSRIVGTVVVLNASSVTVTGSVCWEPAVANYPCLLVSGNATISTSASALTESVITSANYNPSGSPYPWPIGSTNATSGDSYPSAIMGLVYVSGSLTTSSSPTIDVLVVGGLLTTTGSLTLNYDAYYRRNPPPGFYTVTMRPLRGSWQRVTH